MMRAAILVQNWRLPKNRKYARREFARALRSVGIEPNPAYIDFRSPYQNRYTALYFKERPKAYKQGWHKDNIKSAFVICWSNNYPTQIRHRRSKETITVPPKSIVLFNNDYYRHRQDPKAAKSTTRWFMRYIAFEEELPKRFKNPVWVIN